MSTNKEQPRDSIQSQLGYLTKAVEDQGKHLSSYIKRADDRSESQSSRLTKIEKDINVYRGMILIVKFLVGLFILLLTLKFGDIPKLWSSVFGH